MFITSRRVKEIKSQSVESTMLKQVEIDESKMQRRTDKEYRAKLNESKKIITHSKTSKYGNIGNRNYEPIIGKSKSDEYDNGI